jgi:ERCC4-type nuclease
MRSIELNLLPKNLEVTMRKCGFENLHHVMQYTRGAQIKELMKIPTIGIKKARVIRDILKNHRYKEELTCKELM